MALRQIRHRALLNTLRLRTVFEAKSLRFSSQKNEVPPPLCTGEPVPPCNLTTPEPPPCPPPPPPCGPPTPPPKCVVIPDPSNPCNYVPPENPDPSEPDMTSVKKQQCEFQADDGLPVHLKGKRGVFLFQLASVLAVLVVLNSIYTLCKLLRM